MKNNHVKKNIGIMRISITVLFVIYSVLVLFPFLWTFLSSLKGQMEYITTNKFALPKDWLFSNYIKAFQVLSAGGKNMFFMIFNSAWFSIIPSLLSILTSAMMSYVICRYKFVGRNAIYTLALIVTIIPIIGSLPSTYRLYTQLGFYDSPLIILASFTAFGTEFFILYASFKSISWSLAEAAFMDGAGHLKVFFIIMFPQVIAPMSAVGVTEIIARWNDYLTPLVFLKSFPTLSSGLYIYQQESLRQLDYPVLFSGIMICMLPVVVLFFAFQEKLMNLSLGGGIKE